MWCLIIFIIFHILMFTVSSIETDISVLRKKISDLENELAVQKSMNNELRNLINKGGLYHIRLRKAANCSVHYRPIVFHARLASDISPLGLNQIITYDTVVTNEGNTYDTLTGMFEATTTGLYQFLATMWSTDGYNVDFQMILNGAEVCAGRTTTNNQSMGVCSAILHVSAGERVFVRHKGTAGNHAKGNNYAVFTGHLIM
ncbi:C1q-related factor-like [Saccostrea echinata]|uniref:C1q-related factor-like n=1 Tax=Saccostrea echinata TaxID=191078 RepID=UPI002A832555|nr:C1q-related factor-like [Saccostrea echinata]